MSLHDDELAKRLEASIQRAAELQAQLPSPAPLPPAGTPRVRSCPVCGAPMESGSVSVHGTALMFLVVGWSYQNCYFADSSGREEVVIESGHSRPGMRCRKCGFVGIKSGRESPLADPFSNA